jgi:hypothetical protein
MTLRRQQAIRSEDRSGRWNFFEAVIIIPVQDHGCELGYNQVVAVALAQLVRY